MDRSQQDRLDQAIAKTRPEIEPVADFAAWQSSHPDAIRALRMGTYRAGRPWRLGLAVAAMVALAFAIGLSVGRVITKAQTARLQRSVAEMVIAQLAEDMQVYAQECAFAAVAAANTYTQQQITTLVRSVEEARWADRQQVAAALQQIELNRLQDLNYIGNSLYAWATMATQYADQQTN